MGSYEPDHRELYKTCLHGKDFALSDNCSPANEASLQTFYACYAAQDIVGRQLSFAPESNQMSTMDACTLRVLCRNAAAHESGL
ncbi:hypothetical protein GOP47_0029831 [Adiantum capillus-veneris]|nr:hypothetical protein GOP47_0029831 [Adiantum capillus-veneris]